MDNIKLHSEIALIEVTDPLLLEEIQNDAVLEPYMGDRLSDTCIVVQPQGVPEVVRRLQSLGHMPRVIE